MNPRSGIAPVPLLPWASLMWPNHETQAKAHDKEGIQAASSTHIPPAQLSSFLGNAVRATWNEGRSALEPALSSLGLPYRPYPNIADDDRGKPNDEAALRAAVALDVLATWTESLTDKPTILGDVTEILTRLAALGRTVEESDAEANALLLQAQSTAADERVHLARKMALPYQEDSNDATGPTPLLPTPESVAQALRRIEKMAALVVREAHLLLETYEGTEYHQA